MKNRQKGPEKSQASGTKREMNQILVVPVSGGWSVRKAGAKAPSGLYATQAEAMQAAKESLRKHGSGELRVHGRGGRIRDSFVVSRNDFAKISAMEGLTLSAEMKRDFEEFDRQGHSDDQRRKRIVEKYTKHRV